MKPYGMELALDLHHCDPKTFTRKSIKEFIETLCIRIGVERGDLHFWDYEGFPEEYEAAPDRLKGTSVVQFILTSSVVIHTLDVLCKAYLNVFSCDEFDPRVVAELAESHFRGDIVSRTRIDRE